MLVMVSLGKDKPFKTYSWLSSTAILRPGRFALVHLCFWFLFASSLFLKCFVFISSTRIMLALAKSKAFTIWLRVYVRRSASVGRPKIPFAIYISRRTQFGRQERIIQTIVKDGKASKVVIAREFVYWKWLQIYFNHVYCTRAFAMSRSKSKLSDLPTPFINKLQKIKMTWSYSDGKYFTGLTQCKITLNLQAICQSLQAADTLATCILAKNSTSILIS